ncbi:MAG: hypothetical protein RL185_412 [Bacteroidota bacterium]|jgi:hypothetical protein
MRSLYTFLVSLFVATGALAHQFTPTYPRFESSFVDGVMHTRMEIFNKRREVEYYELGVFSQNWEPVTFASEDRIIRVRYLETKKINIYVKNEDLSKVTYICTESRLRKEDVKDTVISSKICSKVK